MASNKCGHGMQTGDSLQCVLAINNIPALEHCMLMQLQSSSQNANRVDTLFKLSGACMKNCDSTILSVHGK